MGKKRLRTLAVIFIICMIVFFPILVIKQHIQGIAVNSQGKLAVAVMSVNTGETVYLYLYSEDDKLQKKVWLNGFRGGIDAIREENDFIGIYYETLRYKYDFSGTFLTKEYFDTENPQSLFECRNGDNKYVYSRNRMGFEKVTKYTADKKSKTVFDGWGLYIRKILWSFIATVALPVPILYCLIYPDTKLDYSREDLQEIDARLHKWLRERKKRKK